MSVRNKKVRNHFLKIMKHCCAIIVLLEITTDICHSSKTETAYFQLVEGEASGTYVGNIAKSSGLIEILSTSELSAVRYRFYDRRNLQTASSFSINSDNGMLYTSALIDRESVCPYQTTCIINFDVIATSANTLLFEIIGVRVNIVDINDNEPRFPSNMVTLYIPEDASVLSEYKIDGAVDPDKGKEYSVKHYDLRSRTDVFSLEVENRLDGSECLKIITNKRLDREDENSYRLYIIAMDGGNPSLSGTLTVNVKVTDVNDNSPSFSKNIYDVDVNENAVIGSSIGQVSAMDKDSSQNAKITYRFSPHRSTEVDKLFYIDSHSGELKVKGHLAYYSGEIFETIVEARDQGNPPRTAQSILLLTIKDISNDPPKISIIPVTDITGSIILLSEGAEINSIVAHIQILDRDEGMNGVVSCASHDPFFGVDSFEGRGGGFLLKVTGQLDREVKHEHNVTIQCTDAGSPALSTNDSLMVRLLDENDNNPRFERQIYCTNFTENNRMGELVVRVFASDLDLGFNSRISYHISIDDKDSMFFIDHGNGEISATSVFDRETISQITFAVHAVDEGSPSRTGSATVVVNISDQNDNTPYFTSSLDFEVPEKHDSSTLVGRLSAHDNDEGLNGHVQFMQLGDQSSEFKEKPFVIMLDGTILTDEILYKSINDRYSIEVLARDNGLPQLSTSAIVNIRVIDSNDNKPIILFPSVNNYTVILSSNIKPGENVAKIIAIDNDEGVNAMLKYYITNGNEDHMFSIPYPESGNLILVKDIIHSHHAIFTLTIEVRDQGVPQQTSASLLSIKVNDVNIRDRKLTANVGVNNSTAENVFDKQTMKYIIVACAIGGATVIISIIVVSLLVLTKCPTLEHKGRSFQSNVTGVQEQGDGKQVEKKLWYSEPDDDDIGIDDENLYYVAKSGKVFTENDDEKDTIVHTSFNTYANIKYVRNCNNPSALTKVKNICETPLSDSKLVNSYFLHSDGDKLPKLSTEQYQPLHTFKKVMLDICIAIIVG